MGDGHPLWHMKPPLRTAAPSHQIELLEIISGYAEIIKGPKTYIQIRMGHIILLPPVLEEITGEIRLGGLLVGTARLFPSQFPHCMRGV